MMSKRGIAGALSIVAVPASAAPDFVPSAAQAFDGFVAINAPRADVPVGALWIDGFGPTGPAADASNLEIVRSLNGVTISKDLSLSLSLGLFNLLGIDPRYRDQFSARFGELSIVKVKDADVLEGPPGEPRIVAALKAASVQVTSGGEKALNARSMGWTVQDVSGQASNGQTKSYSIEGRDLFVAIRVATSKAVQSKSTLINLSEHATSETVSLDGYVVALTGLECVVRVQSCATRPSIGIGRLNTRSYGQPGPATNVVADFATVKLPVPRADGDGGLYTHLHIKLIPTCAVRKSERCPRRAQVELSYLGSRLETVDKPIANGWR